MSNIRRCITLDGEIFDEYTTSYGYYLYYQAGGFTYEYSRAGGAHKLTVFGDPRGSYYKSSSHSSWTRYTTPWFFVRGVDRELVAGLPEIEGLGELQARLEMYVTHSLNTKQGPCVHFEGWHCG